MGRTLQALGHQARLIPPQYVKPFVKRAKNDRNRSGPAGFDGSEPTLRAQFEAAGFREVETTSQTLLFPYPSFDACFGPIEGGEGLVGQEFVAQTGAVRAAVRDDLRRDLGDTCG